MHDNVMFGIKCVG